jgi:prophage maintenance system killer protein
MVFPYKKEYVMDKNEKLEIANVISDFRTALETLDRYDHQQLEIPKAGDYAETKGAITYELAMDAIAVLKEKFRDSGIFGVEKDASFKSSLGQIYQTFDGKDLYPTVQLKAATLLYLLVKNHSFIDGNKRIAAFIFLWYMSRNEILYRVDGTKILSDGALVALTLLIAESKPEERETMVKLVVNLIV